MSNLSLHKRNRRVGEAVEIRMSEVIAALSYALDLTGGQPEGHASRSCLLGMRLSCEIHLSGKESAALFYALLLKDLGCSTNAARMSYLFNADDRATKRSVVALDLDNPLKSIGQVAKIVAPGGTLMEKASGFMRLALSGHKGARGVIEMRCERGAKIARDLQLPELTAEAIRSLYEHWDGHGHPDGLAGDQIPLLGRVLSLAQTFEVYASNEGVEAAYDMARDRRGTWFDPELVAAMEALRGDEPFWERFFGGESRKAVTAFEPDDQMLTADDATLDRIAFGFAQVIDAKSPWTFRHSEGVSTIAAGIARTLGMSDDEVRDIRRAGLLHDIGKLGVSNLILDKPAKLTADEMAEMRKHTAYTFHVLEQVAGFRDLAAMAASHHERLDGKGYHLGLGAEHLPTASRVLAVADMYEALAAKRPYRQDLTNEEVMKILTRNAGDGICPHIFDALKAYLAGGGFVPTAIAA